jgi:predicted transcriptional regulator
MVDHQEVPMWKARDIAEGLFISSRAVSGAMRKLVTDGFVEKVGEDPVVYSLTDLGKTIEIN